MNKIHLAIYENGRSLKSHLLHPNFNDNGIKLSLTINSETLELLQAVPIDVLLLGNDLAYENLIETAQYVKAYCPNIKIIAFPKEETEEAIIPLMIHGIKSFMKLNFDLDELADAIRIVKSDGVYMPDGMASIVQRHLTNLHIQPKSLPINNIEKELIKMISDGLTSKQIGEKLYKSHRTVDDMREKLYKKLEVTNKVELIKVAMKHGL